MVKRSWAWKTHNALGYTCKLTFQMNHIRVTLTASLTLFSYIYICSFPCFAFLPRWPHFSLESSKCLMPWTEHQKLSVQCRRNTCLVLFLSPSKNTHKKNFVQQCLNFCGMNFCIIMKNGHLLVNPWLFLYTLTGHFCCKICGKMKTNVTEK